MNLILNQSEFEHVSEESVYNNNYFRHKKLHYIIHEIYQRMKIIMIFFYSKIIIIFSLVVQ